MAPYAGGPARHQDPGELVMRAAAGEQDAWLEIHDRYVGLLWSIARSYDLSHAEAGDVVQTTWLRLIEQLGRLRDPARVGSWLAVTAHRECLRTIRRLSRERPDTVVVHTYAETGPQPVTKERIRLLMETIPTMPERCRRLLRLLVLAPPLSYAEISAALGIPVGSIGPTRARCIARLRKRLTARSAG